MMSNDVAQRYSFSMPRLDHQSSLDPEILRGIVRRHLPAWFRACASSADSIAMHEGSFGMSAGELLLLGCALKYAALSGKTVHVTCGDDKATASRSKLKSISIDAIYREQRPSSQTRTASEKAQRDARHAASRRA